MEQRVLKTRTRREPNLDAWVATSGSDRPCLVPLSFLRCDGRPLFAAGASSPTVENIALVSRVRVVLDGAPGVVIIDAQADLSGSATMPGVEVEAYVSTAPMHAPWRTRSLLSRRRGSRRAGRTIR